MKNATSEEGGIVYAPGRDAKQPASGAGRPALTVAALAGAGPDVSKDLIKKWLKFCRAHIPLEGMGRLGNGEYLHYHYAQVLHRLGDDGWGRLFPDAPKAERVTWTAYRAAVFDQLRRSQQANGSWTTTGFSVGPVYTTAMHLLILQRDNVPLPRR